MTPAEWTTMVGVVTGICGVLVGAGFRVGIDRHTLRVQGESHIQLKEQFIKHKDDREIHIDPRRDDKAMQTLITNFNGHFEEIKSSLNALNIRCETRGGECIRHFATVERRIAAATGKANGDSDK